MSSVSAAAQSSSSAPSDVLTARRTESHDIAAIIRLITYVTKNVFGRINVTYLLETANLAVTLINQKNEAVAHALFLDYPNWNFVDPAHWENFLQDHYHESKCTPLNTLFLHLFVAAERAAHCSREIIRAVFRTVPELHFILLIIPSQENLGMDLAAAFKPLMKVSDEDVTMEYRLFMCERYWFCAQLFIRQARVEDHDDLTPLFTSQNDTLIETYGEYVLAELIEAQDDENVAVVCEDEGKAVGFMSVCSEVNIQLLHDCFDLGPFHGLCKPHPDDVLQLPQEPDSTAEVSSIPRRERSESTDTHDTETQGIKSETSECTVSVPPSVVESGLSKEAEAEPALPVPSLEQLLDSAQEEALKPSEAPSVEREAFRPIYRGAVNAFCIQLFCIDERYETRSLDFLNFVFKLFPDRDFCIITVPHMVPEFYLIQNFVRVIPFSSCTLDQELYMFHRSGLLKSFIVRSAKSNDIQAVEVLIKTLDLNRSMLDDLNNYTLARRDLDGTPVQAFVAEVLKQIVGIAIIRNEMDVEYIRSHYNVEDFIYFNHHQREDHGHLYHFALNPIFHHYAKHFMKEILRRSYKTCLYYPIHPQTAKGKFQNPCAHSLTSALHYMVPVRPRRQIVYPLEKLGINAPSKQVSKDQAKYALNHFNRKLSLEPKVSVNARIVVIGASNVGISFLETLIFCPHLKFNNLTLISTHGLPGKCMLEKQHKHFLINSHCFNDDDYALMSLCSWVNVVVGKMTGIDRCAKHVTVSEGGKVPYDHLILCTGQQYQVPCATGADIRKLPTNREVIQNRQQRYTGVVPSNLFILSDEEDCLLAMKWAKENLIGVSENVIVYGNTIDVFTTVEALVSLGISGSRIHLVQPPRQSNVTAINDNAIEKAVDKALSKAGVSVHLDSLLAQWNDGSHPDPIVQASFTTKTKAFRLQCSAFFNFTHKRVDYDTFKAVNDACLVYDGKLVIDTNFHTNDVAIRAAGPLTKFSNMYYANEWTHSNFNSKEVGFQLAAAMLNLFDPTLEPVFEPPEDMDRLIPMYKGCKVEAGILPGKYYYLHIYKPGIPTRLDVQETQPSYGMAIKTGNAIKGNYFRIHINQYSLIETITCFSKNPLPVSNYIPLFGQHERLLNNLCSRWKEGLVTDLYSYLKEPWALVIFHDRFIDLKKELREILASIQEENHPSMQGLVQQVVEGELTLLERPKTYLKRFYKQTVYRNLLEKSILSYLNYNNYHLPMFAWPGIV